VKLLTAATALLLTATAVAAPVPKEVKSDGGALEGIWWEARFNDTANKDAATARRFSFNRDGTAGIHQTAGAKPYEYTYAIDRTTVPPSFSWIGGGGREKYRAVYRIDGDTLFIVFENAASPLPKEVKPGMGQVYYELKRVK
jgi:uncharacterized protein (TIGR03067 family)